jgi:hypothetical protein
MICGRKVTDKVATGLPFATCNVAHRDGMTTVLARVSVVSISERGLNIPALRARNPSM